LVRTHSAPVQWTTFIKPEIVRFKELLCGCH
jgi:hypothetical protein